MINVSASCNIIVFLLFNLCCQGGSEPLRVDQGVNQISAQQQYNDSK